MITSNTDGSGVIATGGIAQTLFGGAIPSTGFFVANLDPTNDLWIQDGGTAGVSSSGSLRIPPNGGLYETPATYRPSGAISIIGDVTGQKYTARGW